MNKKCWILFSLCLSSGLIELILTFLNGNFDILSVLVCSFGLLFFILFLIEFERYRKNNSK